MAFCTLQKTMDASTHDTSSEEKLTPLMSNAEQWPAKLPRNEMFHNVPTRQFLYSFCQCPFEMHQRKVSSHTMPLISHMRIVHTTHVLWTDRCMDNRQLYLRYAQFVSVWQYFQIEWNGIDEIYCISRLYFVGRVRSLNSLTEWLWSPPSPT